MGIPVASFVQGVSSSLPVAASMASRTVSPAVNRVALHALASRVALHAPAL